MNDTDIENIKIAVAIMKHDLFGDPADAEQLMSLFDSWESRSAAFEGACGAILRVLNNNDIDVEALLDWLALHMAGEQ